MVKIVVFTLITVMLVVGGIVLNTTLMPTGVYAAPQATPQAAPPSKPDLGTGNQPASALAPQITAPNTGPEFSYPEGQAMVIVQLDAPPLVEVFQQAYQATNSLSDALAAMRSEQKAHNTLRQTVIAQLTAPPFNARMISATSIVSNTLIIDVDASLIPQITALPGVLAARIDRTGQLHDSTQSPNQPNSPIQPPGFGPVLD